MPVFSRQQWNRYDLTKEEVEAAIIKACEGAEGVVLTEVGINEDGSAFVRWYAGELSGKE